MQTKRAATLKDTLRLKQLPENGTAWHELLQKGLPYASLRATAKALGIKEAEMTAQLGMKGVQVAARKRARRLNAAESDLLYGIALAFVKLSRFKELAEARAWLLEPCSALKDYRPIDLLTTRIGTQYVTTAIDRMRPTPSILKLAAREDPEESESEAESD